MSLVSSDYEFYQKLAELSSELDKCDISRTDVLELILALRYNRFYGKVPQRTHLKLIELFCKSSGKIQDLIHWLRLDPYSDVLINIKLQSDLFSITPSQFTSVIHELSDNGYCMLPFELSNVLLEAVNNFVSNTEHDCLFEDHKSLRTQKLILHNPVPSKIIRASIPEEALRSCLLIRRIIDDPVLKSLASVYLKSKVLVPSISLWHSFDGASASSYDSLAQAFHFDLDEFRWLKLFIFLTDVFDQNGPHVYVPGTHKPGKKNTELLNRGYNRISDDDMKLFYPELQWEKIYCPSGTMIFADTRCFHKGTPVIKGMRSVLQPLYSPTSFSKSFL